MYQKDRMKTFTYTLERCLIRAPMFSKAEHTQSRELMSSSAAGGKREDRWEGEKKGKMERERVAHFIGCLYSPRFISIKAIYFYVKNSDHQTDGP